MQINSVQNYGQNNLIQINNKPAFKSIRVATEYVGPLYKYGTREAQSKYKSIVSELSQMCTDLKIKTDWDDRIVGDWPEYMVDVVKNLKENWFRREKYEEAIVPFINKYAKTDKKEIQELKKKYNGMIDSMGKQGKSLDIEFYPAPPHTDTSYGHMVYVIPALGMEGVINDYHENNDAYYVEPYGYPRYYKRIYLPSERTIDNIKLEIFNKLNSIFEEGIKNGQEKIIVPQPEGKHDKKVLEQLKENAERYDRMKKDYHIKDEEKYNREWDYKFLYSRRSESCEDYFESQARETARFVHDRRFAFNEEMEDD